MSEQSNHSPRSNPWRGRTKTTPIPREEAIRQGKISRSAFQTLGKDAVIAFLNGENAALGGRPLALATASADGALRVEAEIARLGQADPANGGA